MLLEFIGERKNPATFCRSYVQPLLKVRAEFRKILIGMGFEEMPTNRWVESSFWNFDALFQPQSHPARDSHDTREAPRTENSSPLSVSLSLSLSLSRDRTRCDVYVLFAERDLFPFAPQKKLCRSTLGRFCSFFVKEPARTVHWPEDYFDRVREMHVSGGAGSIGHRSPYDAEESRHAASLTLATRALGDSIRLARAGVARTCCARTRRRSRRACCSNWPTSRQNGVAGYIYIYIYTSRDGFVSTL